MNPLVAAQSIEQMDSRDRSSESLADTEAEQIRRVLTATNGNKSRAAKILGIERKTLYRKLERMGLLILSGSSDWMVAPRSCARLPVKD